MQHLLLAVFEHRSDARAAMDELLASGFDASDLRLSEGDPVNALHAEPDNGGIGAFFKAIFGVDRSQAAQMYADAVTRGHVVLTLCGSDPEALARAADIVDDFGAIDIEARQEQWRGAAALRTGAGVRQDGAPGARQSAEPDRPPAPAAEPVQRSRRGGARLYQQPEPLALQRRAIDHMFDPADLPALQPQSPEPGPDSFEQLAPHHDAAFRHHWRTTYADSGEAFDDYAPAYRYGVRMRQSPNFRDLSWDDAETDLRQDWQATKPASTWDKVKAAIRHGWERITS